MVLSAGVQNVYFRISLRRVAWAVLTWCWQAEIKMWVFNLQNARKNAHSCTKTPHPHAFTAISWGGMFGLIAVLMGSVSLISHVFVFGCISWTVCAKKVWERRAASKDSALLHLKFPPPKKKIHKTDFPVSLYAQSLGTGSHCSLLPLWSDKMIPSLWEIYFVLFLLVLMPVFFSPYILLGFDSVFAASSF